MAWKLCGAKTRAGTPCKRIAGRNGRCKLHGGRSTGAKKPHRPYRNQNALRHGIFASGWTNEEQTRLPEFVSAIGDLDSEIVVAKIQLDRVNRRIREVLEGEHQPLEEAEVREDRAGRKLLHRTSTKRRPDYLAIQDRLLGRIGRLTEQRLRVLEATALQEELDILWEKMESLRRVRGAER